jgi:hypothetical protein
MSAGKRYLSLSLELVFRGASTKEYAKSPNRNIKVVKSAIKFNVIILLLEISY